MPFCRCFSRSVRNVRTPRAQTWRSTLMMSLISPEWNDENPSAQRLGAPAADTRADARSRARRRAHPGRSAAAGSDAPAGSAVAANKQACVRFHGFLGSVKFSFVAKREARRSRAMKFSVKLFFEAPHDLGREARRHANFVAKREALRSLAHSPPRSLPVQRAGGRWAVAPRYMICVIHFCTLRESNRSRENRTRAGTSGPHPGLSASPGSGSEAFGTLARCETGRPSPELAR